MTVELRPWTPGDAGALHAAAVLGPDVARQLGGVSDREGCERLVAERLAVWGPDRFHVAVTVDGLVVGDVGVSEVERRHDTAWVHYWLADGYRGRGLAVRGLATVAAWAFDELGVFRLELGHRLENPGSCRVATRAGFAPEGVERAKLRYGTERFDVETHARLATDPAPDVEHLPFHRPH